MTKLYFHCLKSALLMSSVLLLSACGDSDDSARTQVGGGASDGASGTFHETAVASTAPDTDTIALTYIRQYEPLPDHVAEHPAECDWISYLRFRHKGGPQDPSAADAILMVMPGRAAGAGYFDILARNVIHNAAEQGKFVEFWALERRSNCIEDRRGMMVAAQAQDYRLAIDYYFNERELDGHRFEGFKGSDDLEYLTDFGLARTVLDWYAVMTKAIPDPELRARKVFCGGHSFGGIVTAAFSAWDFDGNSSTTEDAGFNQCAGYFALESPVDNEVTLLGGLSPVADVATAPAYAAAVEALRAGAIPRIEGVQAPYTPEVLLTVTLSALAAYQDPDGTGLIEELPRTPAIDQTTRLLFSRDAVTFASGQPDIRDVRMTNEALLGGFMDDNSQPLGFLATSLGTFKGGAVIEKTFPTPGAVTAGLSATPGGLLVNPNALMIPDEFNGPVYAWRRYDQMDEPDAEVQLDHLGQPFTSAASENTDIHQWARTVFEAPADLVEWYFPMRLTLDSVAAQAGVRSGDLAPMIHDDGPLARPLITILGGESIGSPLNFTKTLRSQPGDQLIVLPGYNHTDIASAARIQNDGSREKGSQALTDFVLSIVAP